MNKRFFIVFYKVKSERFSGNGHIDITVEGDYPFLNRNRVIEIIKEQNPEINKEVVLTGFNEISEQEYKVWKD